MPRLEPELIARRVEAFRIKRAKLIEQHGWYIQGVFGDEDNPITWSYSVGLFPKVGFELIMFGLRMEMAQPVLNDIAAALSAGDPLLYDTPVSAGKWFRNDIYIMYKRCQQAKLATYLNQAFDYFNRGDIPAVQVVLCDKNGKFPGDPTYDPHMSKAQPELF